MYLLKYLNFSKGVLKRYVIYTILWMRSYVNLKKYANLQTSLTLDGTRAYPSNRYAAWAVCFWSSSRRLFFLEWEMVTNLTGTQVKKILKINRPLILTSRVVPRFHGARDRSILSHRNRRNPVGEISRGRETSTDFQQIAGWWKRIKKSFVAPGECENVLRLCYASFIFCPRCSQWYL